MTPKIEAAARALVEDADRHGGAVSSSKLADLRAAIKTFDNHVDIIHRRLYGESIRQEHEEPQSADELARYMT